jgi:hypothetical protein
MAGRDHNYTRRAVLGAAFAVPALASAASAGAAAPAAARWRRALAGLRRAEAAMAAFERRCAAAGITENLWEVDETSGDHLGTFISALQRLMRTPAPDLPALALKIEFLVDHEVGSLSDGERCLAALRADARRLADQGQ